MGWYAISGRARSWASKSAGSSKWGRCSPTPRSSRLARCRPLFSVYGRAPLSRTPNSVMRHTEVHDDGYSYKQMVLDLLPHPTSPQVIERGPRYEEPENKTAVPRRNLRRLPANDVGVHVVPNGPGQQDGTSRHAPQAKTPRPDQRPGLRRLGLLLLPPWA